MRLLHCKYEKTWKKSHSQFLANKLCIPASSIYMLLLHELHRGGLMGYFGAKKMKGIRANHFFWPQMRRDVERFVAHYTICQKRLVTIKSIWFVYACSYY
jgi:hypothetical protein